MPIECPYCKTSLEDHIACQCMDAWLAKSLGCNVLRETDTYHCVCSNRNHGTDSLFELYNYSTDISAAMGVLPEILKKYDVEITLYQDGTHTIDIEFQDYDNYGLVVSCKGKGLNKLPLTIAKAVIAVMEKR